MTVEVWPFGPVDVTSDQYSRLFNAVSAPGVVSGLNVSAVSGQMKVSISAGNAIINGFSYETTAAIELNITANSSGITRRDVVVAQMNVLSESFTLGVVTGYDDVDLPIISSEPEGMTEIPLAIVDVPDGATAITSGMITTYQQKIGSGYVIADNLADLPLDGNIGISTDTGLIRTRDTGSWSDWSQDVDASQVTSGRISADRLPFAPEQVVVNDIGNNYSPVYISSAGDWGWTGTTKTELYRYSGYFQGNNTKMGSSAATRTLLGKSSSQIFSTSAPTDPTLINKYNAGISATGFVFVRVVLPKILYSSGAWSGTQADIEVRIVNPFTEVPYFSQVTKMPYRNYTNSSGYQEVVYVKIPVVTNLGWAWQVRIYGYKTITTSGNDGKLESASFVLNLRQNPFLEGD